MRLVHTTEEQNEILTAADNAEGVAAKAAEVCLSLDFQLSAALAEIQSLKAAFAAMCEQRDAATEALENLENDDGAIPPSAWQMAQAAIANAGGTPKPGPPDTNIRARAAAYRDALAPACADFVAKLEGLFVAKMDGLFIAAASAVLAQDARNTDTQPKEETP